MRIIRENTITENNNLPTLNPDPKFSFEIINEHKSLLRFCGQYLVESSLL